MLTMRPPVQESATDPFRDAVLKEAEQICRRGLSTDPNAAHLLHLRGLLASRGKQEDFAIACLRRAATLDQGNSIYLADLGDLLTRKGHHAEAVATYLQGLVIAPRNADLYSRLGRALVQQGRADEAIAAHMEALQLLSDSVPATVRVHADIGDALRARGRQADAVARYELGLRLNPNDVDLHLRIGHARLESGQLELAAVSFRKGLQLRQDRSDLYVGLGTTLIRSGAFAEALDVLMKGLRLNPHDVQVCQHVLFATELSGRTQDTVGAWYALGEALEIEERLDEAAEAYQQAVTRKPDCLRALCQLGWVQIKRGQPRLAIPSLEAALRVEPQHRWGHIGLGQALHLTGDLVRGWQELFWYSQEDDKRRFEQPKWDGTPLEGKTILLWSDWYLGDTIQLVRYARLVKQQSGGRVLVECHRKLLPLIARMDSVDGVIARNTPLPAFDVHAPLGELPRILGTSRETIHSEMPYLSVDPRLKETWRQKLGASTEKTVGLVWAGEPTRDNARVRFAPLAAVEALAESTGVRCVSLQLGGPLAELYAAPPSLRVEQLLTESSSIDETAALLSNLDLVITVDTMAAHLSAALGRPTWLLLPLAADWRWHAEVDLTPWYPTIKVFSQASSGDWTAVLMRVRLALDERY
jgi:tetratricopeptide (TPR) repeat protein